MSCYHPLIGVPTGDLTVNGKPEYKIRSSSLSADFQLELDSNPDHIIVPCGHCLGCRLDYSRRWADRMMLELDSVNGRASFLTLTYDNDHITWNQFDEFDNPLFGTLVKRDCQLFLKRLRKYFSDLHIRFFLAGEYGEHTLRPHYHMIVFGLAPDDFPDLLPDGKNEFGQPYFKSQKLNDIWQNGRCVIAGVNWQTCAYVARYVTKKLSGPWSIDYAARNVIPEFSLMSRKPGIGKPYLDAHPDCLDLANINLSTPDGGLKIMIPKYFLKELELTDPERYDSIMESRKQFANDKRFLKLQKTGLSYLDALEVEEQKKLDSVKTLKRGRVE